MLHKGQPLGGYPNRKRLDLRCPHRGNTGDQAAQGKTAGAVKQTAQGQFSIHFFFSTSFTSSE